MNVQVCSQRAKFILMTKEKETHEIYAIEAIEAVTRKGLKRYRLVFGAIFAAIVIGLTILWVIQREEQANTPGKLAESPVAVLLPNMDEGAVKDNAARQWEGFKLAFEKNQVFDTNESTHRHVYHFNYPLNLPDDRDAIINQIKDWYDAGIRTFIMTMSGAVSSIKDEFTDWAGTLPSNDQPVLVATVASAPGIAEREKGVFRHYIRSKDESGMLATVAESLNAAEVFVFYVNDTYGDKANKILDDRLSKTTTFKSFQVAVKFNQEAKDEIKSNVNKILSDTTSSKTAVVIIVGYGSMISYTLETLRDAKGINEDSFEGKVLVVSTFTEETWRPKNLTSEHVSPAGIEPFDERIYTVGPVQPEGFDKKPGVVYQFSYLTLDRALHCKDKRGVEGFWSCWSNIKDYEGGYLEVAGVEVEFTEDGDSHVTLRLLNKDHW